MSKKRKQKQSLKQRIVKRCKALSSNVKKRLSKVVESVKESLKAQAFYAKQGVRNIIENVLPIAKASILGASFSLSVLVLGMSGQYVHEAYIESKVAPNVFFVQSMPDAPIQARGTAFAMKAKSGKIYTVTNAHICGLRNKDNQISVLEHRTGRMIPLRVLEVYPDNDLCIVEGVSGYEGLEMGEETEVSQHVWAFGHALGEELNISSGRVKAFKPIIMADETIESPEKCVGPRHKLEKFDTFFFGIMQVCTTSFDSVATDVTTFPGNSGSPMVDKFGKVVGVIFAANSRSNWGYAVPLKDLRKLLEAY